MDPFGKSNFIFQPLIFIGYLSFWGSSQPGNLPKVGVQNCKRSNPRPLTWKYSQIVRGWIIMQWLLHVSAWKQYSLLHFSVPYLKDSPTKIHLLQRFVFLVSFFPDISSMQPFRSTLTSKSQKTLVQFLPQGHLFVLFAHPSCWRSKSFIAIGLLMSDQLRIPSRVLRILEVE